MRRCARRDATSSPAPLRWSPRRAAGSTGSPTRSRRSGRASSRGRRRSTRPCGWACRPAPPRRSPSSRSSGAPASTSRSRRSAPTMICCCRWPPAPRAGSTPSWSTRTRWGTWCRSRRWSRWTARWSPTARRWRRRSPIRRPTRTCEHSVPLDFAYPGVAIRRSLSLSDLSWRAFFALPKTYPLQVTIPDEPDVVIGAALLATGHDWNSDDDGDLEDVVDLLAPLRGVIRVSRRPPAIGPGRAVAAMVRSLEAVETGRRSRFYLPSEGSAVLVRSWAIPIYAPHPVSANAWLANALNPAVAAGTVGGHAAADAGRGGPSAGRAVAAPRPARLPAARVERGDGGARRVGGIGGEAPGDLAGSGPVIAPLLWLLLSSLGLLHPASTGVHTWEGRAPGRGHPSVRADGGRHRHRGHRRAAAQGPQGGGDRGRPSATRRRATARSGRPASSPAPRADR